MTRLLEWAAESNNIPLLWLLAVIFFVWSVNQLWQFINVIRGGKKSHDEQWFSLWDRKRKRIKILQEAKANESVDENIGKMLRDQIEAEEFERAFKKSLTKKQRESAAYIVRVSNGGIKPQRAAKAARFMDWKSESADSVVVETGKAEIFSFWLFNIFSIAVFLIGVLFVFGPLILPNEFSIAQMTMLIVTGVVYAASAFFISMQNDEYIAALQIQRVLSKSSQSEMDE